MAKFLSSIEVDADADQAFGYLADFSNAAEWDPGLLRASRADSGELGVGSEFDVTRTFYGREIPLRYRITDFEAPGRVILEASSRRAKARDEITITNAPDGCTISYHAEFSLGGVLKIFDRGLQVAFESMRKKAAAGIEKALAP